MSVGFAQELAVYQSFECQHIRSQLIDRGYKGTGRGRLAEYYSVASDERWTLTESGDYLRAHSALDESKPSQPSVITPIAVELDHLCAPSRLLLRVLREQM